MHLLSVDKVAVMTLDLNFAFFFFLFFFFFLSRDVYSIHCQWRCVVFSGVRRGTPVCCCNYFDYTYYGVLQQPGERVQFNLQWISILTENEREREKKSLAGIFNQRRDIRIVARCELLCVCVCVFVCDYNKQQGCILDCGVQGLHFSFAFDQFAMMGIGLHPDIWQSRGPHWWSLLSQKMPGAWFGTNAHKQKHKHTRGTPCVCVRVCVYSPLWLAEG